MQTSLMGVLNATFVLCARCLIKKKKKKHRGIDKPIHTVCVLEEIKDKVISPLRNRVSQLQNYYKRIS